MRRWLATAALLAALVCSPRAARADARGTAERARARVVKITAAFGGDSPVTKHGFGFVASERDGFLYIATANHVVRSDIDDAPAGTATVQFFFDQGVSHPATILETHRRAPLDLAVIKVAKPGSPSGPELCDDSRAIQRNLPAAYVGRDGEWYVPTADGTVNSEAPDEGFHIEVDFSRTVAVKEGTSGAPLVSERGLLGMIIQDANSNVATVLAVDAIARAFRGWNHPWTAVACPKPPPLLPDEGFELGMRAGVGLPFGSFSGYSATIPSEIGAIVPLVLEGGYHLTSNINLGAFFQYADVQLSDAGCGYVGNNCGGTQTLVGLFGRYRRPLRDRFDVWGGLGAGYEWLSYHGDSYTVDHRGVEALRFEVGGDVVITRRVSIGPFVSFSFSRFDWGRNTMTDAGADLNSRRWHEWLVLGVRMAVAVVR